MSDIVDNKNAPRVRFIRRHGRVIPIIEGKRKGVKPRVAASIVDNKLGEMRDSVEQAEQGHRAFIGYGSDAEVRGFKSTYPSWYNGLGVKNKKDFFSALDTPGAKQDRIVGEAVNQIKKSSEGLKFEVATRQVFDNEGVQFRRINGRVVPIKSGKKSGKRKGVSDWDFDL